MTRQAAPRWEQFAQEDPEVYIWARSREGAGAYQDEFFDYGRAEAPVILARAEPFLHGRDLVVEFGCGVGRLLIPMREHFGSALGVDISATMLARLRHNCHERGITGVDTALAADPWDESISADFVYCWAVLQHIASTEVMREALRKMARALKPGSGVALLHFNTEARTMSYWLRFLVPDPLLPRFWRRSIRRIRRPARQVRRMLADAGFQVVAEHGDDPAYRLFVVRVPVRAAG